MQRETPLGIQANNWCNIRFVPGPNGAWRGLASPPSLRGFCHFLSPDIGITVALRILRKHQADGAHSIAEQIAGIGANHQFAWAPATENDTETYIATVVQRMAKCWPDGGWTGETPLDLWKPGLAMAFLEGMVQQEVGLSPTASAPTIRTGVALAPPRPA
jgi:hypothetical protein